MRKYIKNNFIYFILLWRIPEFIHGFEEYMEKLGGGVQEQMHNTFKHEWFDGHGGTIAEKCTVASYLWAHGAILSWLTRGSLKKTKDKWDLIHVKHFNQDYIGSNGIWGNKTKFTTIQQVEGHNRDKYIRKRRKHY